jgi:hypothetical protein
MSASDTARPERSGRVFLHGPMYQDKINMNYPRDVRKRAQTVEEHGDVADRA